MEHYIKIAEMRIGKMEDVIKTTLGSCIGLCYWDKTKSTGGMVHIMMPQSNGNINFKKEKYANTAVNALLEEMIKHGSKKNNIKAHVIGGETMFPNNNDRLSIGWQNYQEVKKQLKLSNIIILIGICDQKLVY